MRRLLRRIGSFLSELKRRKVYRVAAVYAVVAVGGLELADVLVPASRLPEWSEEFFLVLAIVGLPVVLVLAWTFDLTSQGVRRTGTAGDEEGAAQGAGAPARDTAAAAGLDPNTVAVLPFANLSEAADVAPFAAGLHDDLLTELSRASALTVISRTSVQRYRDTDRSMTAIGRELGAGTIVEGGVQKAGDRVRLNVQLIDARSDVHLWAERYDRELSMETIFELQSELAARIMEALHAKLTGSEIAREGEQPTADLEAYRQYSIGRALFVDRSEEALRGAAKHFEAAVERDPEYALAWAGLGMALIGIVDYRHADSEELLARGERAGRKALELDPDLAEGHSALGWLHSHEKRCREALEAHERAIALRPSYAGAHQWRCWVSLLIGDPRTAVEAGERARRLDPLDPEAAANLALAHVGCGDDEEALRVGLAALEKYPEFDYARWVAALAYGHLDRREAARESLGALTESWAATWPATARGLDHARRGDRAGARAVLDEHRGSGAAFHAGLLHAALGEADEAFDAIRGVLPLEWDEALFLRYYRETPLPLLRSDSHWEALMRDLDRGWGA